MPHLPILLIGLLFGLQLATPAAAFVLPDLSPDNDDPIVVPLLEDGLWSLEVGLEDGSFDCDCTHAPEGGGDLDLAVGLHYDVSTRDHIAWRFGVRGGQKSLHYILDGTDAPTYEVAFTYARLQASIGLYASPWDYLTLLVGAGGFATVFLDVDDDVSGSGSVDGDYARGEAGLTIGAMLLFSPGRGRSWAWSLGGWFDLGLSPVGAPPGIDERPVSTRGFVLDLGLHF